MTEQNRELAIDAVDTLTDVMADLFAGTMVLLDYRQRHKAGDFETPQMIAVQKMCLCHLVLSFSKLLEFWERFHQVVPYEHRDELKALNRKLSERNVKGFRNAIAGHIWDRRLGRPVRHSEVMAGLELLVNGDMGDFLRWVNNPENNTYPRTVFSVVEAIRDSLVDEYAIRPQEVIDR